MSEIPEWPGPNHAEEGVTYQRSNPYGDSDRFAVDRIQSRDDGSIIVDGRWL